MITLLNKNKDKHDLPMHITLERVWGNCGGLTLLDSLICPYCFTIW